MTSSAQRIAARMLLGLLGLLVFASVGAHAQAPSETPRAASVPVGELLREDGTLDLTRGEEGSVDLTGYQMVTGGGGTPRFVPGAAPDRSAPSGENGAGGPVNAMAIGPDGSLYVVGWFVTAGETAANGVARWDGSEWHALGSGLTGWTGEVNAVAVSGNDVYVGGRFTHAGGVPAKGVARWDGTAWHALGEGGEHVLNDFVTALAVSEGDVYVGGHFTMAYSTAGNVALNYVARWDGTSWHALGEGAANGVAGWVYALAASGSDVYVVGATVTAGGAPAYRIARWDGTSWHALGGGVGDPRQLNRLHAVAVSGSDVYVGGRITQAGGTEANYVARWDGSEWHPLGTGAANGVNGEVNALAVSGSAVYVGGAFTQAGGALASNVARWDGSAWHALGDETDNGVSGGSVTAVAVSGSDVYVGGYFTHAGGVPANSIARWDGTAWHPLRDGAANGVNGSVYELVVSGGNVYVGGGFTQAGETAANHVAWWDGTAWHALGAGAANGVSGFGGSVYDVEVSGSDVYFGGRFTHAGSTAANNVARWDGSAWHALGAGVGYAQTAWVHALEVSGGEVYAGGKFASAGGVPASYVARWNGTAWRALGEGAANGVSGDGTDIAGVFELAVSGGEVYAGGQFTYAGGAVANNVARWDGSAWHSLGGGTDGGVSAYVIGLAASGTDVYAGGHFTLAGETVANRIAWWDGMAWNALEGAVGTNPTDPVTPPVAEDTHHLSAPRPNPFRAQAVLTLEVTRSQHVESALYDVLGRRVMTLFEGQVAAGTSQALTLDGSRLAAGAYVVRVRGANFTDAVRVTVPR